MALCFSSYSNAQTVDPVTGNLINPNGWAGVTYGTHPGDCCSGGPQPLYDTSNSTINFSYGNYNVANLVDFYANSALNQPGTKIIGYNYSWKIKSESQNGLDPVNASIGLYSPTGYYIEGYSYPNMYSGTYTGSQNFTKPYSLSEARYLQLNFQAVDAGFWAGYYGPQVSNISLSARYSVDPCATNPLYASHCPGFNDIVTSGNLIPNSNAYASWGGIIDQSIAISTALQHGGLGVKVHGVNWGYDVYSASPYYAGFFDYRDPLVRTTASITNSSGNTLYSITRDYNDIDSWQSKSYSYVFPQSINSLNLGNLRLEGQTWDYAGIGNLWANIKYTPDICVSNPLYSPSCTGYAQAFYNQQCTNNPLYDSGCPGYQQAYFTQQCSINPLYDSGCPGYAQAYFTQQCSLNALYNQSCPGYAQAYFTQQCNLNALYNTQCPGYAQAKTLKDLQEQRTAQTETTSSPTTSSTTTSTTSSPTATTNAATADPTKTETVVTTDVGGVELTTSGQISIPTGQTASTKESIKESSVATVSEDKKKEETRKVDPRALSVARAAVAATERTALSVSENAVALSQSESATFTGVTLGTGITLQGFKPVGVQTENESTRETSTVQQKQNTNLEIQMNNVAIIKDQETQSKSGSSVKNGGKVEGMEGGPDPAQLARAPMDFNQYLIMQMRDSQFYASKEIYRGQRNVDNPAGRRLMTGSDRLHDEMVRQQYK